MNVSLWCQFQGILEQNYFLFFWEIICLKDQFFMISQKKLNNFSKQSVSQVLAALICKEVLQPTPFLWLNPKRTNNFTQKVEWIKPQNQGIEFTFYSACSIGGSFAALSPNQSWVVDQRRSVNTFPHFPLNIFFQFRWFCQIILGDYSDLN